MTPERAGPRTFAAQWYDGSSAVPRAGVVALEPDGVRISGEGAATRLWAFGELVLMRGDASGEPVQIERRSQPVEVIIVEDRAFLVALRAALPAGQRLGRAGSAHGALRALVGLALVALVLGSLGYWVALPALTDFAAARVPPEWEQRYGEAVIADLAPAAQRVEEESIVRPARELHKTLSLNMPRGMFTPRLIVTRNDVPNAFAAPGGHVMVTTGLLKALRTPDELAAVIAHELGHVRRHHVMRGIVRQMGLQVLLLVVAGDQSAWSGGLRAAGELGGLAYSRSLEREADDEAIATLRQHGASPLALIGALESLQAAAPEGASLPGFLSTHPATPERVARIRAASGERDVAGAAPEWREGSGWAEMKKALEGAGGH